MESETNERPEPAEADSKGSEGRDPAPVPSQHTPADDSPNPTSSSLPEPEAQRAAEAEATEEPSPTPPASGWDPNELQGAIEAVLYAASEPLSHRELRRIFPEAAPEDVKRSVQELVRLYALDGRGLHIVEVAGGYQIATRPEYHERVSSLFKFKPPSRLSIQALETLATIAYRQPITLPEIQELRGVRSASVIRTLLEKKLIRIMGRKNVVGRPLLYGTTKQFLMRFGLKDLSELPRLEDMAEVFGEDVAQQLEELGAGAADAGPQRPLILTGEPSETLETLSSNGEAPQEPPDGRDPGIPSPD